MAYHSKVQSLTTYSMPGVAYPYPWRKEIDGIQINHRWTATMFERLARRATGGMNGKVYNQG